VRLARRYRTASHALSAVAGSGVLARASRELAGGALP